jgi:hypothetical protein
VTFATANFRLDHARSDQHRISTHYLTWEHLQTLTKATLSNTGFALSYRARRPVLAVRPGAQPFTALLPQRTSQQTRAPEWPQQQLHHQHAQQEHKHVDQRHLIIAARTGPAYMSSLAVLPNTWAQMDDRGVATYTPTKLTIAIGTAR